MDLAECPYCKMLGLITTIRVTPGGFEVTGECRVCGYGYDSQHEPEEEGEDLPWEFEVVEEAEVRD